MDLIVCGDALWLSCGTWLQFWSGAFGAFTSALLAAGVALLVVWLSNKHQSKALKLELEEQREEASKARAYAAISDLVAAAELALAKYQEDDVAADSFVAMRSAASRLALDMDSLALKTELRIWANLMLSLQEEARLEYRLFVEGRPAIDDEGIAAGRLARATALFTECIGGWPASSDGQKSVILERLSTNRRAFTNQSDAFRDMAGPMLPGRRLGSLAEVGWGQLDTSLIAERAD
ncbi:hypothetical protein [Arthrobacter sp. ok362]|uniref:hypothetical protein n=1 Tax=Arthrobacter sp. ok362 TaxID=1761745 RepID=UPI000885BCB2|nr:hypothetical protein [Arthrobacter sp. ok362]SDK80127.1 hypothetical protein SAMN04487913_103225 [Arthrobacter sp. ok362]